MDISTTRKKTFPIHGVMKILKREVKAWNPTVMGEIAENKRDPFRVLISTVLSLRTKDECTSAASKRLFAISSTPKKMLSLSREKIAKTIYPVGFYNIKAGNIKKICSILIEKYGGVVPDEIEELLTLPGVGRKTANLVVTIGYGKPGICVDTHVHRITNRWGYVKTKSPEKTEFALRKKLPRKYWIEINDLLVMYGKNRCTPVSPRCSECPLEVYCRKVGVTRQR